MNGTSDSREFRFSETIYRYLLLAYPRTHRGDYGAAMTQLFHDQCRDAWGQAGNWGLCKLWLRILPDLVNTSILERLSAFKRRKTMSEKLANLMGFRITPASMFVSVFVTVFVLVFVTSVAITFVLPEVYASTARIKVEPDAPVANGQPAAYDPEFGPTTFELIQSELILKPVVEKLNLNVEWGKKYYNGDVLKSAESMAILKQRLQLSPVRGTKLIAITAYSDDKNEAATVANAVADSYLNYRAHNRDEQEMQAAAALQKLYAEKESQIQSAQVELGAMQAKYAIPDNVDALESSLVTTRKIMFEEQSQLSRLREADAGQRRRLLAATVDDAALTDLLRKLRDAEQSYAALTNDYGLSNVAVTRVTSLINVLNRQIDDREAGMMAGLESKVTGCKSAADDLAAAVQRSKPSPESEPYWTAKHNLEQMNESHKLLFAKMEDQKLKMQMPRAPLAQIVDPAQPGMAPVKPNKTLNISLGAILAFLLATAAGGGLALVSFAAGKRTRKTTAAV